MLWEEEKPGWVRAESVAKWKGGHWEGVAISTKAVMGSLDAQAALKQRLEEHERRRKPRRDPGREIVNAKALWQECAWCVSGAWWQLRETTKEFEFSL